MKRIWLAALVIGLSGAALAQPMRNLSSQPLAPTDIQIPPRKLAAPVPALLQTRAHEIYSTTCSGCHGITACVARQGSAFSFYLMEKPPADLHDIIEGHDFNRDVALRRALIQRGVFFVPIATKQCSLSAAHSDADVEFTLEQFESAVAAVW